MHSFSLSPNFISFRLALLHGHTRLSLGLLHALSPSYSRFLSSILLRSIFYLVAALPHFADFATFGFVLLSPRFLICLLVFRFFSALPRRYHFPISLPCLLPNFFLSISFHISLSLSLSLSSSFSRLLTVFISFSLPFFYSKIHLSRSLQFSLTFSPFSLYLLPSLRRSLSLSL